MNQSGTPEQSPDALEVLSQRIGDLRSDSGEKREGAAKLLAGATGIAVVTGARRFPLAVGVPLAVAAVYKGYKKAAESRDSAAEASQLLTLHQYDMFSQMGVGGEQDQGEAPSQPQ